MRFELKADGETTVFSFIDNWAQDAVPGETMLPKEADEIDKHQPGGPGTPWSGVAAGWHGMIDALETYLTGKTLNYSWEDGCKFYADYLTNHFRWQKLMAPKRESSGEGPNMTRIRPVFRIKSYEDGVAHYVDWLGFTIDWEWREAPGRPVIMAISRDSVDMHLVEGDEHPPSSWIQVIVEDIQTLADELNAKRPDSVSISGGWPYVQQILLKDPFGNLLVFEQPQSPDDKVAADERDTRMRNYIRERLDAGHACPMPEEVVEAVCPPVVFSATIRAAAVLGEFPEYEQATREDNPEREEPR